MANTKNLNSKDRDNIVLTEKQIEKIQWHLQSSNDILDVAFEGWGGHRFILIMRNGLTVNAKSYIDEGSDGSVSGSLESLEQGEPGSVIETDDIYMWSIIPEFDSLWGWEV